MYTCRFCGGTLTPQNNPTITCPYCQAKQPNPDPHAKLTAAEQAQQKSEAAKTRKAIRKRHSYKNRILLGICLATHLLCASVSALLFPIFSPQLAERFSPAFLGQFLVFGLAMYAVLNSITVLLTVLTFLLALTRADGPLYMLSRAITGVGCALILLAPIGLFELNMAENFCILLFCKLRKIKNLHSITTILVHSI